MPAPWFLPTPRCRPPRPVACRHGVVRVGRKGRERAGRTTQPARPCRWCEGPIPPGAPEGRLYCSEKSRQRLRYYTRERGKPRPRMTRVYAAKKTLGLCVQTGCYAKATLTSPRCDACRAKLALRTRDAKRYARACRAAGLRAA